VLSCFKESEADANSDTKESEADDSSVSSLSMTESIWEKGYSLPLIPVCIRGFLHPCMHTGIFKNLHIGRCITHNEIVHIWGLIYMILGQNS